MKRIIVFTTALLLGFLGLETSYAAKKTCSVKGKITGFDSKTSIYVIKRIGEFGADTVVRAQFNDKGEFSFIVPEAAQAELLDVRFSSLRGSFSFVSEPGKIQVEGDKSNLFGVKVGGTVENVRWNTYQKQVMVWAKEQNALNMSQDIPKEQKLERYQALNSLQKEYVDSLIQHYPGSVVSLYLAKIPLPMLNHVEIGVLLEQFEPYFATHRYYQEMKERYDILRKISVGMDAPDFTAVREDGKTAISLSDFKGKYVLLDFWASWCVPCRAENKHTKALYEKYHSLGLEFISFSLDNDLKAWNNAIQVDGITWNNASDLKIGKLSPVAQKYGIDGIPAIWIIDPEGKVIGDNIRGSELDEFLAKIFVK